MQLSHLNSFFEVFAAINLGFAGSSRIRSILGRLPIKLANYLITWIGHRSAGFNNIIEVIRKDHPETDLSKIIENGNVEIQVYIWGYLIKIRALRLFLKKLPDRFRTVFLLSGLYCIFFIFLGAMEPFATSQPISAGLIVISNTLILYNIIIFILEASYICPKEISPVWPTLTFFIVLLTILFLYVAWYEHTIKEMDGVISFKGCIHFSIAVATSGFFLFFIRHVIFHIHCLILIVICFRGVDKRVNKLDFITGESIFPIVFSDQSKWKRKYVRMYRRILFLSS